MYLVMIMVLLEKGAVIMTSSLVYRPVKPKQGNIYSFTVSSFYHGTSIRDIYFVLILCHLY